MPQKKKKFFLEFIYRPSNIFIYLIFLVVIKSSIVPVIAFRDRITYHDKNYPICQDKSSDTQRRIEISMLASEISENEHHDTGILYVKIHLTVNVLF